jgi:hypothetical protein
VKETRSHNRWIISDELLTEFMSMDWWPHGGETFISAGFAGHEREIVVNIDGYDNPFELRRRVPEQVAEAVGWLLPTWYIQNRSTRIECHPSGSFAGGYKPEDLTALAEALERIGLNVTRIEDRSSEGEET